MTKNLNLIALAWRRRAAAASSSSDSDHKFEVFAGYSFLNNNISFADDEDGPVQIVHGYAASVTYNLNRNFGVMADFSGHNGSMNGQIFSDPTHQTEDQYYFLFGPSVSHSFGKARISGHVLVGVAQAALRRHVRGRELIRL